MKSPPLTPARVAKTPAPPPPAKGFDATRLLFWKSHESDTVYKVRGDSIAPFFRRFATMLGAGITLVQALDFLSHSEDDIALARVISDMVRGLQNGQKLSDTMRPSRMRKVFNPVMVGLVSLGEKTGHLRESIDRLADLSESQLRLRRATRAALTYPAVLVTVISLVGLVFVAVLGDKDQGLFSLFGNDLPWPTKILCNLSSYIKNPLTWLVSFSLLAAAIVGLSKRLENNDDFRLKMHSLVLQIPVIGPLISKAMSARILYVLSNCLAVGVPMLESLKLARNVCTNEKTKVSLEESLRHFSRGAALSDSFAVSGLFPPLVVSMVAMGQETGKLDTMMERVTAIFEEDVESALESATRLVEPILLGVAGVLSAFLALATLMPIIQVVNKL